MGKRHLSDSHEFEPCKKRLATSEVIKPGDILYDITGKNWRLGRPVGEGAFGEIFAASDCTLRDVPDHSPYIAKLELHSNGPLFVETHFYLKVAKEEQINEWKEKSRKSIGLPHYIASGSHTKLSTRYRFLILPRYNVDLQQILDHHENKFNVKTVLTIALQLIDTLEYVHSKGFIHGDIKASNILTLEKTTPRLPPKSAPDLPREVISRQNTKSLRPRRACRHKKMKELHSDSVLIDLIEDDNTVELSPSHDPNQVVLLDFGLAAKYMHSNGEHKPYCVDERKAHAGTILFCSLDAHIGVQSRRSDLESLGYNMVFWLTHTLPWIINVEDYEVVKKKKQICMQELENFLHFCFGKDIPLFLKNYFKHIKSLTFDQAPDYEYCRKVLLQGFCEYGYKKVFTLDFENKEGWGFKKKRVKNSENDRRRTSVVCSIIRTPLKSNLPAKHALRKKDRSKNKSIMRWSKILLDPEMIIKSGKKVKEECDNCDTLANLNINDLNPTDTMKEVYRNYCEKLYYMEVGIREKSNEPPPIEGYNATMMAIYKKILQRQEADQVVTKTPNKKRNATQRKSKKKPIPVKKQKKKTQVAESMVVSPISARRRYNTRSSAK